MFQFERSDVKNRLLRALPEDVFGMLRPNMEEVKLPLRHVLVEAGEPTEYVCFLESGLASVVASRGKTEEIEVGHIGREGMSATHILLKTPVTSNRTFVQVAGTGIQLPVDALEDALEHSPASRSLLLRYVHTTEIQLAHSALANGRYTMHERLARWLLMCHDRLDGDHLPLTHEFLSIMLGVRRSGVTNEVHILEGLGAIRATRGDIHVIDREKLEAIAGGSYGAPEREYERVISGATALA
jgi:CRP-like cAMP-binding protein